jgi:hypothetical protein
MRGPPAETRVSWGATGDGPGASRCAAASGRVVPVAWCLSAAARFGPRRRIPSVQGRSRARPEEGRAQRAATISPDAGRRVALAVDAIEVAPECIVEDEGLTPSSRAATCRPRPTRRRRWGRLAPRWRLRRGDHDRHEGRFGHSDEPGNAPARGDGLSSGAGAVGRLRDLRARVHRELLDQGVGVAVGRRESWAPQRSCL